MIRLLTDAQQLRDVLGIDFSDEQMAAIQAPADAPSVIVAGAGSGKTTVMAARVVWLVGHEGVNASEIIGLTFTRKAAAELSSRIRHALKQLSQSAHIEDFETEYGEPTISTYDSFAGQLIDEFGVLHGIETDVRLETDSSRFLRATEVARETTTWFEYLQWKNIDDQILSFDSELNNHLVDLDQLRHSTHELIKRYEKQRETFEVGVAEIRQKANRDKLTGFADGAISNAYARLELLDLVEAYRAAKVRDGVAEFSDRMAAGALLAMSSPDVQAAMRQRFSVVLLDEYQDTSGSQGRLLQALFGDGRAVTAVGDPMQNIYGWRGAAGGTLSRFVTDFPRKDGKPADVYHLTVARRSDSLILEAANAIAAELLENETLVHKLQAKENVERGTVSVTNALTEDDELAGIVQRIDTAHKKGMKFSDMAILLRTWKPSVGIVAALRKADIPIEIVGLPGLLRQPEILDVVSLLEAATLAHANKAVVRLLTNPRWHVGPRDLTLLAKRAQDVSGRTKHVESKDLRDLFYGAVDNSDPSDLPNLVDAIASPGDKYEFTDHARAAFSEVSTLIRTMRSHRNAPIIDQIHTATELLGLDVELRLLPQGEQAIENLAAFSMAAHTYLTGASTPTMNGFLTYLQKAHDTEKSLAIPTPSTSDSVKLMTIHSAKGLEWKVVFVPWMIGQVFPTYPKGEFWYHVPQALPAETRLDAIYSTPDLNVDDVMAHRELLSNLHKAEERRLAYVAFTRAAKELHISGHWWSTEGSRSRSRPVSPFLNDVYTWAGEVDGVEVNWIDKEAKGKENPAPSRAVRWPLPVVKNEARRAAADAVRLAGAIGLHDAFIDIDKDIELLLAESHRGTENLIEIALPSSLSTTALVTINENFEAYVQQRYRPMPTQPIAASRRGTRFHEWVANFYLNATLLDPKSFMMVADDSTDEDDLVQFIENFQSSEFSGLVPVAIETEVHTSFAGHLIKAKIDAVFADGDGFRVVDWKTNKNQTADPLQLAIYRLAWAEHQNIDPAKVAAGFFYVATGQWVEFDDLPDREEIETQLATNLKL